MYVLSRYLRQSVQGKHALPIYSGLALALILLAGAFGAFSFATAASSPSFSPAINLSNDSNLAKQPAVSNNGQNVYVVWTEGGKGIFFRVSTDGGSTWTPPTTSSALRLSNKGGVANFPAMFTQYQNVNTGDVYATWAQTVSGQLQIFVAASTNNGLSFRTTQLSTASGNIPSIAAWGSDVYVGWNQLSGCSINAGGSCIVVAASTDNGQTWGTPIEVNSAVGAAEEQLVASGSNLYVVADGVFFEASYDNGATFSTPVSMTSWLSSPANTFGSFPREPWIAAWGNDLVITYEASSVQTGISGYQDYGNVSTDGGKTWTGLADSALVGTKPHNAPNDWEPENVAYGTYQFLTFHSLGNQGIYVTSSSTNGASWSTSPTLVSPTRLQTSFPHVYSSDGVHVFTMWGQQVSSGSSTWNAYISYSGDSGTTWSAPIDISNNAAGVAAGNKDVTLFALSSYGVHCFAAWTFTSGSTSQIYFAAS